MEDEFPANTRESKLSNEVLDDEKKINKVVVGKVVTRRTPIHRTIVRTFVKEDFSTVWRSVVMEVIIPSAQDTLIEGINGFAERMFGGRSKTIGRSMATLGQTVITNYNKPSTIRNEPTVATPDGRAMNDFTEFVMSDMGDAKALKAELLRLATEYNYATRFDLYQIFDRPTQHVDNKWGWPPADIEGAEIARVRGGGYFLELPKPVSIG